MSYSENPVQEWIVRRLIAADVPVVRGHVLSQSHDVLQIQRALTTGINITVGHVVASNNDRLVVMQVVKTLKGVQVLEREAVVVRLEDSLTRQSIAACP